MRTGIPIRLRPMVVGVALSAIAVAPPRAVAQGCAGDCDTSSAVTVDEIIVAVSIALGMADVGACPFADANRDLQVLVDEILLAVNSALEGCPPPQTRTQTPTVTPTVTATSSPTQPTPTVGDDGTRCFQPGESAPPVARWFTDVTAGAGLDADATEPRVTEFGRGAAVGDIDGDDRPDIVLTGGIGVVSGESAPSRAFRATGPAGTPQFEELASGDLERGAAVTLADLDNDGNLDLVVLGTDGVAIQPGRGDGQFSPVAARLPATDLPPISVTAGDVDNDGLLDLVVGAGHRWHLFRGEGGLRFVDVTSAWGLDGLRGFVYSPAIFDADGDGALDLYISVDTDVDDAGLGDPPPALPGDLLYLRQGSDDSGIPLFDERAAALGLGAPRSSMGLTLADFDGDGSADWYVSNIGRNHLLLRQTDGSYVEGADRFGLAATRRIHDDCAADSRDRRCLLSSWDSEVVDVDGDGWDDLLVANGFGGQEQPASTYRGGPDASFTAVWTGFGCASVRTLIATDLDADGDPDLIATAIAGPVLVLRNDTPPASRLCIRLRGTRSNREGRGAIVTLTKASGRRIARYAGAGGSVLGHGPVEACYGLGDDVPMAVEVRWPAGGLQSVPAATGLMTITEP